MTADTGRCFGADNNKKFDVNLTVKMQVWCAIYCPQNRALPAITSLQDGRIAAEELRESMAQRKSFFLEDVEDVDGTAQDSVNQDEKTARVSRPFTLGIPMEDA